MFDPLFETEIAGTPPDPGLYIKGVPEAAQPFASGIEAMGGPNLLQV